MKKKRQRRFQTVNWKDLEKGDVIKVFNGHGPHTMIDGQRHSIGAPGGLYRVSWLSPDGIHAYEGISHVFIYMGIEKKSLVGTSAPHKIKKVLTRTKSKV
jgi:hypothetical protein